MKISSQTAKALAVAGMIVLCVLSYSLFMSLSAKVVVFVAVLVILSIVYAKTAAKDVPLENDLIRDYTSEK